MGWNDIRVHLLAAGSKTVKTPSPRARTAEGDPVQLIRFEAIRPRDLPTYAEVIASLEKRGFRLEDKTSRYAVFVMGPTQASITLDDADSHLVMELELQFECTPTSPADLPQWSRLVTSLADEFNLSPMNYTSLTAYVSAEQAIRSTLTWKEFSERYGWGD